MVPDTGEDRRVEHLQKQAGDAPDHHGGDVTMDAPRDGVLAEYTVRLAGYRLFTKRLVVKDGNNAGRDGVFDRLRK
jgi:hypothetical protein